MAVLVDDPSQIADQQYGPSENYISISEKFSYQCISEPWSIADDEKVPLRTSEALWKGWVCQNELLVTDNAKFLTFHFDCPNWKMYFFQITKCICPFLQNVFVKMAYWSLAMLNS